MQSEPLDARTQVWALSLSLAATHKIDVSFSSSGYLDVSVHRVPLHTLWIGVWIRTVFVRGFPHSDISGSRLICSSPKLFAAYHVFHRLLVPRHPPCALYCLTILYFCSKARLHSVAISCWNDFSFFVLIKNVSVVFSSISTLRLSSASDVLSHYLVFNILDI